METWLQYNSQFTACKDRKSGHMFDKAACQPRLVAYIVHVFENWLLFRKYL